MSLVVAGTGLPALATAAYASANAGEQVELLAPDVTDAEAVTTVSVSGSGMDASVLLRSDVSDVRSDVALVVDNVESLDTQVRRFGERGATRAILVAPGGFAGSLRAERLLADLGRTDVKVSEAPGFAVLARRPSADEVAVVAVKESMPVAGPNAEHTEHALADYGRYLPELAASDLVTTSLSNVNSVTHPPLVLLNAARIDAGEEFLICGDGLTPATDRFLTALDAERVALVNALGGEGIDTAAWLLRYYGSQGMSGTDIGSCLRSFPPLMQTPAPRQLDHRYLTDDIPHGVAAYLQLAQKLGTPHHHLAAIVTLSSTIIGRPLSADESAVEAFLAWANV